MKIQRGPINEHSSSTRSDSQSPSLPSNRAASPTTSVQQTPAALDDEPRAITHYAFRSGVDADAVAPTRESEIGSAGLPLPATTRKSASRLHSKGKLQLLGGLAGAGLLGVGLGVKLVSTSRSLDQTQALLSDTLAKMQAVHVATDANIASLQKQVQMLTAQSQSAAHNQSAMAEYIFQVSDDAQVMNFTLGILRHQLDLPNMYTSSLYEAMVAQNNSILRLTQSMNYPPLSLSDISDPQAQPSQDAKDMAIGSWKAIPAVLYPSGRAVPGDINQHGIGDCDGDAALAALAWTYPESISDLVTDNGDSTYNVSMVDPDNKPITMRLDNTFLADSSGKLIQTGTADNQANWATVLNKAVAKYNSIYKTGPTDDFRLGGIWYYQMLEPLFGKGLKQEFGAGQTTEAQASKFISDAKSAGALIVCNTWGNASTASDSARDALIAGHGYTVLGLHTTANNETYVVMRNPWGVAAVTDQGAYDDTQDGVNTLAISTFVRDWYYQAYLPPKPLKRASAHETEKYALEGLQDALLELMPSHNQAATQAQQALLKAYAARDVEGFKTAAAVLVDAYKATSSQSTDAFDVEFPNFVLQAATVNIDLLAILVATT